MSLRHDVQNALRDWYPERDWPRLWLENGVDPEYRLKSLGNIILDLFLTVHTSVQNVQFADLIEQVKMEADPIFIVGHWRSGTTHLHNIISQDPRFGYVTTLQSVVPHGFLSGNMSARSLVSQLVPSRRTFDDVVVTPDTPQEEEFAITHGSMHGFYHGYFFFPRSAQYYFRTYILFDPISPENLTAWKDVYRRCLRSATFGMGGKQLLLKNPPNTARIRILREMFPKSKFIHIYRNPFNVFNSTNRMRLDMLKICTVQRYEEAQIADETFEFYTKMMHRYFDEQHLIPPEDLVEVRFEDLERQPMVELERVYSMLGLRDFPSTSKLFERYLKSVSGYMKTGRRLDPDTEAKIKRHWAFTIDRWNYSPPR